MGAPTGLYGHHVYHWRWEHTCLGFVIISVIMAKT
mgnify:CR=1 FL=1